ncbi:hypothetical protein NLJ89_g10413 [Agrocybe chaxingu]|uniref:Uncharacterized protein n=1 Tax=Agrocybe chaxingu TaxID=84603 RepID=A0A9W8JU95_9AGAR|nr:hypothetical protein NLJ89_g10413 [Agrocybe chaxingu]
MFPLPSTFGMAFGDALNSSSRAVNLPAFEGLLDQVSLSVISQGIVTLIKAVLCVLLLLCARSLPFVWTLRVFRALIVWKLQHKWLRFRMLFKFSHEARLKMEDEWMDSQSPVGDNPFDKVVSSRQWASLDECDINLHLSNSSYAKTLDSVRFSAMAKMLPMLIPINGWVPLAATHYHFIREIPMLSTYEIRTSFGAWDQKWIYVVSKFVRKSTDKKHKRNEKPDSPPVEGSGRFDMIRTPGSEPLSLSVTPLPSPILHTGADTDNILKGVAAGLSLVEADGATVHTIAISQVCFKIGRITVPPSLILAVNGYTGAGGHSLASPHQQWFESKKIMSKLHGGSPRKLRELLTGGWRNVPEKERWWDQALGGNLEAQRVKNLALIEGLRRGMESAANL